jgi:(2R)-sulfolactate sulfo-lyase subunit alpha
MSGLVFPRQGDVKRFFDHDPRQTGENPKRKLQDDWSQNAPCGAAAVCGILERFGRVYTPPVSRGRMATQFIVHDKADTVGVVVVEDVRPGQDLTGWVMETDETITLKALDAVPLGHKIALRDIKNGETVLKYGHDVGRAVSDVGKGRHVHVHNLKTKRW